MAFTIRQVAQTVVERLKAKAFLAEQAINQPSLHWWITRTDNDAQLVHQELFKELDRVVSKTDVTNKLLGFHNNSSIYCFPLGDLEMHRGESPQTIVFDHVEIDHDLYVSFFSTIRSFGTANVFTIASKING